MALVLNGTTQYAQIASAIVSSVPLSLVFWIKYSVVNAAQVAFDIHNSASAQNRNMYRSGITAAAAAYSQTGSASAAAAAVGGNGTASAGVWDHFVAEFSANNARRIIKNGTQLTTESTNIAPTGLNRTTIGAVGINTPSQFVNGKICAAAIYGKALSGGELTSLQTLAPWLVSPGDLIDTWDLRSNAVSKLGINNYTLFGSPSFDGDNPPIDFGDRGGIPLSLLFWR